MPSCSARPPRRCASSPPIAREALERIGDLYDIERRITGLPAEQRLEIRTRESRPRVEAFHAWLTGQIARLPGKGDLAKAMRYALPRPAGRPSRCSSRTAAWRWTTTPRNAPSSQW